MSILWWTDKDNNIVYTYNEILFKLLKNMTGNSAICKKIDEPWEHYPQWNQPEWTNRIWHYLHEES